MSLHSPETAPREPTAFADLHFLVVEDHGFQRWLIGNLLQGLGAGEITFASDGEAALAVVRDPRRPVDIAICDLDMPGMDGMEFIRHLGAAASSVSLVVCSAMDRALVVSVEAMAQAYGVRLLGAVEKPATAGKLASVVARLGEDPQPLQDAPGAFSLAEIVEGLRRGQFEPYFQPQVEMASGRALGAEALARWIHPYKGPIEPVQFIEPLEGGGFIGRLTDAMVRSALATCCSWRAAGLDATVSVNLSLRAIAVPALAERMTDQVAEFGLEPRHVVLELTESAAAPDVGIALEVLSRLRMRGFGLSIDDYGMGYSSMQQLARIPFTELKIDRGFVRDAAAHQAGRAMLESSLEMAQKLGITAVAEGVETRAEWELLRELGCPVVQGYYVARPMPAGQFLDWARRQPAPAAARGD